MSHAMNQKAPKKRKNKKTNKTRRSSVMPVVEEEVIEEELTFGDKLLANITPYMGTIVFALLAGFAAFALVAFLLRSSADSRAFEWRELNSASSIARQTGNISQWKRVAEEYPDSKAGLWASQFAGDYQLREGLSLLATDQEAGFGLIKKSKSYFESIINAPDSAKTPMLQQRSHFSLAYACEGLGEFEESKKLYEKLIKEAPDSAFVEHARRGLHRATNDDYSDLYAKFTNWEQEEIGEAPGPRIPERPSIDFPDLDLPPGEKPPTTSAIVPGGDFEGSATKMATEKKPADGAAPVMTKPVDGAAAVVTKKPADAAVVETVEKVAIPKVTMPAEIKPVEVKPVEVKPVEVKPIEVKPIEVKPIEVKPVEVKPVVTQATEAASGAKPVVEAVTEKVLEAVEATK